MTMDRWDGIALVGCALLSAGVYRLLGLGWTLVLVGGSLVVLYLAREISVVLAQRRP